MKYIYNINLNDEDIASNEFGNISLLYTDEACFVTLNDKNILSLLISGDEESYTSIKNDLKSIIAYNEHMDDDKEYAKECKNFLAYLNNTSSKDFFSSFNIASIVGTLDDIIEYIKENPWLKDKKIIKNDIYELSDEGLNKAIEDVKYIKSQTGVEVTILIEGNEEAISINEFKEVLKIINQMVNEIKSLNLSPFEATLYAYDLVRNHEYKMEEKGEYHTKSRDLSAVLLGDKIVCFGFVNIFNTILNKLNIKCKRFQLLSIKDNEDNHVETVAYIQDDKYKIDGLYLFDPTFECKESDNSYLTRYYFFAKTFAEMKDIYKHENLEPFCKYLSLSEIEELDKKIPEEITPMELSRYRLLKGLNSLLTLLNLRPLEFSFYNNKEDIISSYQKVSIALNKIIPIKAFIEAFIKVRSLEYYNDTKYPFSKESIEASIYSNSVSKLGISIQELALLKILDINPYKLKRKKIKEIASPFIDEQKILEIKLTKLLKDKLMTIK